MITGEALRERLRALVTFTLEALDEDHAPDFDDAESVAWAREQVARGNIWGWCCARVTATLTLPNGDTVSGSDHLGGCSYKGEAEFRADPYFADMQAEAICDLAQQIERACASIAVIDGVIGASS